MNKIYSPINWENEPSSNTPINEANLNKMDTAINELDNRVISQDTIKANKADLSNLIKEWVIDETTGVITLTKYNGEQVIFDLNIEKVPVSFYLDDDGILYMTTDDGTTFSANIGSMIPVFTFEPSDTIAVSVSGSGVNKTYSFSIKTASVTEDLLQPNFLADIWTAANNAELSADNARDYATQSQSYAVGGTGSRDGEDTDNAKHYKEQVQSIYNDLAKGQVLGVKGSNETAYRTGNVEITPENIGALPEDSNIAMLYRGNITADTTNIETLPLGIYGVGNVKGLTYNIKPYSYVIKTNSSNMYGSLMVLFQTGDVRGVYHFDASTNQFEKVGSNDYLPLDGNANTATKAGWSTYLGESTDKYSALLPRTKNGTPPSKVTGPMFIQADYDNTLIALGFNGLGTVPVYLAYADKNGNQIDTTYATRANTVPVFSRGGSYSTLADFMTEAQTGDTCGSSNVFCRFKDIGGWTGEINWYKAWVSWQNGIGNGLWEIDGNIILLRGDSTFKFGVVSGGKTDASDLTVTWYDITTSKELANYSKNKSTHLKRTTPEAVGAGSVYIDQIDIDLLIQSEEGGVVDYEIVSVQTTPCSSYLTVAYIGNKFYLTYTAPSGSIPLSYYVSVFYKLV